MGDERIEARVANAADLDAWAQMRAALWPDSPVAQHREEARVQLSRDEWIAFVAHTPDGQRIAFVEVCIRPFANGCESQPVPFVEGIWVDPLRRRRGVARRLLARVQKWADERGFRELGSDVEIENVGSLRAHAAWGFEETERVVYFRKRW